MQRFFEGRRTEFPADIFPHVAAVKEFVDSHFSEIYEIELQQANKAEGFGGTLDLYGLMYTGETALVDWKTSRATERIAHGLQTAAYRLLCIAEGRQVDRRLVVRICKDPGREGHLIIRSFDAHDEEQEAFRGLVKYWHFANKNKLLKWQKEREEQQQGNGEVESGSV